MKAIVALWSTAFVAFYVAVWYGDLPWWLPPLWFLTCMAGGMAGRVGAEAWFTRRRPPVPPGYREHLHNDVRIRAEMRDYLRLLRDGEAEADDRLEAIARLFDREVMIGALIQEHLPDNDECGPQPDP